MESNVVKQSIDSFSSNVEEQLMEKVRLSKFYLLCDTEELKQKSDCTLVFKMFPVDSWRFGLTFVHQKKKKKLNLSGYNIYIN